MKKLTAIEQIEFFDSLSNYASVPLVFDLVNNCFIPSPDIVVVVKWHFADVPESYLLLRENTEQEESICDKEVIIDYMKENILIFHSSKYLFLYFSHVADYVAALVNEKQPDGFFPSIKEVECDNINSPGLVSGTTGKRSTMSVEDIKAELVHSLFLAENKANVLHKRSQGQDAESFGMMASLLNYFRENV